MLFSTLFEVMGVGLIFPAITIIMEPNVIQIYPEVAPLIKLMGYPSHNRLIMIGMCGLFLVYLFKNLFLSYFTWLQFRFVNSVQVNLSQQLFQTYIGRSYDFHLQENSARLIRNIISEVTSFQNALLQIIIFVTEVSIIFSISLLLFAMEPIGVTISVLSIGLAAWLFNIITRQYSYKWGQSRVYHSGQSTKHLMQGFGAIKDIKILGREDEFLKKFYFDNSKSSQSNRNNSFLSALPRLYLELFSIAGLILLVFVMLYHGKSTDIIIKTVGLFAVAAFRLMPSVYKSLNAIQYLRFIGPSISMIYNELAYKKDVDAQSRIVDNVPITFKSKAPDKFIQLECISFSYPATQKLVLKNITLSITKGASIGFIGPSGSGKSTLVDIIIGLLKPQNGFVFNHGNNIHESKMKLREWQNQIGYVPQTIYLTDDSLLRNIAFGIPDSEISETAVKNAIKISMLDSFVDSLPEGLATIVGERGVRLSGGQRQRIGIARAIYHNPSILVLDEATSSLDSITEKEVMEAVKKMRDKTVLIIAHRLSTVEHCNLIYKLEKGEIIFKGPPKTVLSKN
jgi:ABC-type multidrug transport system fused ATPase/permease subunit